MIITILIAISALVALIVVQRQVRALAYEIEDLGARVRRLEHRQSLKGLRQVTLAMRHGGKDRG